MEHIFNLLVANIFYVVFSAIGFDVITGVLASMVERKINSSISYVGFIRKVGLIVALGFLVFVDTYLSSSGYLAQKGYVIRLGVGMILAYEIMSIVENFSRIGINIKFITKYFDKSKLGQGDDQHEQVEK